MNLRTVMRRLSGMRRNESGRLWKKARKTGAGGMDRILKEAGDQAAEIS